MQNKMAAFTQRLGVCVCVCMHKQSVCLTLFG